MRHSIKNPSNVFLLSLQIQKKMIISLAGSTDFFRLIYYVEFIRKNEEEDQ